MARILVTEDDPVQLKLRKMVLEAAGHEVVVACDRPETIGELRRQRPDLLMMDLRLADPNGEPDVREGLSLIRGVHEMDSRLPVIVLSGWPAELYGQPEEEMVSRVILKPARSRDLLDTIEELTA